MRRQRLPEELILEILLRVPVRFLRKLECVCKLWKTLISNPRFKKDYFRTSFSVTSMTHQRLVALTINHAIGGKELTTCSLQSLFENPASPKTFSFRVEPRWIRIIGSCNGLLCLSDDYGFFKLRNPFTRSATKRSPPIDTNSQYVMIEMITHYGFGYDQLNDKYKVLVTYGFPRAITKLHIVGTKSWTTIQNFPQCKRPQEQPDQWEKVGTFVTGTLNWLVLKTTEDHQPTIISFHLEKETYGEVLLPHHTDGDLHPCTLDVFNKCLCLCYSNHIHCVMWLMKKYSIQESWTKLILIPRLKIPKRIDAPPPPFRLVCISETGVALVESNDLQCVFMYNTKNGESNYPKIMRTHRHYMHIYHESLISPL